MNKKVLLKLISKRMNQNNSELEICMEENYELMCGPFAAENEAILREELLIIIKDEEHLLEWLSYYLELYLVNTTRKKTVRNQMEKERKKFNSDFGFET